MSSAVIFNQMWVASDFFQFFSLYFVFKEAFLDMPQIWQHVSAHVFSNCILWILTWFPCKLSIVPYYLSTLHCALPMSWGQAVMLGMAELLPCWCGSREQGPQYKLCQAMQKGPVTSGPWVKCISHDFILWMIERLWRKQAEASICCWTYFDGL